MTGAAGAIGSATARKLAERGARVIGVDHPSADGGPVETARWPRRIHPAARRRDRRSRVCGYVEKSLALGSRIDIFFNNAGIEGTQASIQDYPTDEFVRVFNVNVLGVFLGMKYVLPLMQAQKSGSIINTSSIAGLIGAANMSSYIISKHAVLGLTRTASLEAAPFGVRVNSVHPGFIESRMLTDIVHNLGVPGAEALVPAVPLGRLGTIDDIAIAVAFLASDESSYVTGHSLLVDRGKTVG
ncbi:SDR family NAD(P)-dependent oxidoreductase [Croceibacterium salegens]|uniref:SDR family NAD(P)-dependent oxidoreductase n=1 Tax=Croceibacterium salegens TaxID=1737568 RepID=UPI0019153D6A|nr:SDR family oxidoreductase [Croceibacterium salegens]